MALKRWHGGARLGVLVSAVPCRLSDLRISFLEEEEYGCMKNEEGKTYESYSS